MSPAPEVPDCPSRSWRDLAAPIASGVCLVHCVGLALLAPILPAALTVTVDDPKLELALWGSAAALSLWMLLRSRALVPSAVFAGWGIGAAVGLIGLVRGGHGLLTVSLLAFSAVQLVAFVRRFRAHHADHAHGTCDHDHDHLPERGPGLPTRALDPEPPR